MAEDRFATLKEKYVLVLNTINKQDLRVEKMHVEQDKLFIRAKAPSEDAKNKFWDAVKKVDPNYSKDFTAEIQVTPAAAQAKPGGGAPLAPGVVPASGSAPTATAGSARTYTVVKGDTLSKISKHFYGNANDYMRIFEANRDQLKDPDKIYPGQVLKIPDTKIT